MALDLTEIRQQITQIDRRLLKLLSERRRLALEAGLAKEAMQKPLRDLAREQALLQELLELAERDDYQLDPQYITAIFQKIMEHSLLTQQAYLAQKYHSESG